MAINLKITQVRSGIGRPDTQKRTLAGLGLRGPHKSVVLKDTESLHQHPPYGHLHEWRSVSLLPWRLGR